MSDIRGDPRPSMVNPYGAPTATMYIAETWRPDGWEGEVMVIVSERFEITETMKDGHNRVEFPIGTYLIPARINRKIRRLTPDGEYVEMEKTLDIAGIDEASMHWALKAHKVRHSSHQPALYAPAVEPVPQTAAPEPKLAPGPFCSQCGTHRSLGHTEECPLYVPSPLPKPGEGPRQEASINRDERQDANRRPPPLTGSGLRAPPPGRPR